MINFISGMFSHRWFEVHAERIKIVVEQNIFTFYSIPLFNFVQRSPPAFYDLANIFLF